MSRFSTCCPSSANCWRAKQELPSPHVIQDGGIRGSLERQLNDIEDNNSNLPALQVETPEGLLLQLIKAHDDLELS